MVDRSSIDAILYITVKQMRGQTQMDGYRRIEVTVAIWIKEDADPSDVVSEMDYNMTHPDIVDTEVVDINTEV